jgi:TPP-dependent pyruvate/acetoin dehydrogenase alpha subunit
MFIYDRQRNFFLSAIIGGTPAIAAGIAWALKRKGSAQKVWCFVGDGTEDNGHLFEAVRYVEGWDLPCTFIIEDNNRSVDTTLSGRNPLEFRFRMPSCVIRNHYTPTYPHAGNGTKKHIIFKERK